MNILSKVSIVGFWDRFDISINLHEDVNFLIGVNGSGKTTAINMIAATLEADFVALDRLPFRKILLQLQEIGGNKKPLVEVEKRRLKKSPFSGIKYSIRDKSTGKPTIYSLDDLEEQLALREYPPRYFREYLYRSNRGLNNHLRKLINTSWLSIHRTESRKQRDEEGGYESSVDRKLNELSNEFVRYFSLLSKEASAEAEEFQKIVFLSLISHQRRQDLFSAVLQLQIDDEKDALAQIFKEFNVDEKVFVKDLERHFSTFKKAMKRLITKEAGIGADELVSIVSARRIHSVVQEWKKVVKRQERIFEPRESFLATVNTLFKGKQLKVNEKNELSAFTEQIGSLPLSRLSSGEKQLLIILGEAVLQGKTPWVYIADEPELSLHVDWQEKLIRSLRGLNPNSQILFATHSPDIVSTFGENVFDMENILK